MIKKEFGVTKKGGGAGRGRKCFIVSLSSVVKSMPFAYSYYIVHYVFNKFLCPFRVKDEIK